MPEAPAPLPPDGLDVGATIRGDRLEAVTQGVVQLYKRHYGRGPTRGKTYLIDDRYVLTVLREVMTTAEHTLVRIERPELVRQARLGVQAALAHELHQVVQAALGRQVLAHHGQLSPASDCAFELFTLAPRAPFGED